VAALCERLLWAVHVGQTNNVWQDYGDAVSCNALAWDPQNDLNIKCHALPLYKATILKKS
jgi:hypothetical protein